MIWCIECVDAQVYRKGAGWSTSVSSLIVFELEHRLTLVDLKIQEIHQPLVLVVGVLVV